MLSADHSKANDELQRLAKANNVVLVDEAGHGVASNSGNSNTHVDRNTKVSSGAPGSNQATQAGRSPAESKEAQSIRADRSTHSPDDKGYSTGDHPSNNDKDSAAELSALSGADFDRRYIERQVDDHKMAISKFEQASRTASNPELKQFATQTLPTLRAHLKQAESLQSDLGKK